MGGAVKGTDDFQNAKCRAQTGNWEGAAGLTRFLATILRFDMSACCRTVRSVWRFGDGVMGAGRTADASRLTSSGRVAGCTEQAPVGA